MKLSNYKKSSVVDTYSKVESALSGYGFATTHGLDFDFIAIQFSETLALDLVSTDKTDLVLKDIVSLDTFYKLQNAKERFGFREVGIVIYSSKLATFKFLPYQLLNSLGEYEYYNVAISVSQLPNFSSELNKWRQVAV